MDASGLRHVDERVPRQMMKIFTVLFDPRGFVVGNHELYFVAELVARAEKRDDDLVDFVESAAGVAAGGEDDGRDVAVVEIARRKVG